MTNPRRQSFHFGRPVVEHNGSISPDSLGGFVRGASRLLIFFSVRDEEWLRPQPSFDFSIASSAVIRVARTAAGDAHRLITNDALKTELYDRLPPSKHQQVTGEVVGAAVLGEPGVLTLSLESPELRAEQAAAVDAVRDIFGLGPDVDLEPSDYLNVTLGRFRRPPGGNIRTAVEEATAEFAEGAHLTFAPLPDPRQVAGQA